MSSAGLQFGIVVGRFNDKITERLLESAIETLRDHGADESDIVVAKVPGAFELPLALKALAGTQTFNALIGLGCVIRGETPHFDFISNECARGCMELGLTLNLPVIFGVLTCDTPAQAEARSTKGSRDKGVESAIAAIEMASLIRQTSN